LQDTMKLTGQAACKRMVRSALKLAKFRKAPMGISVSSLMQHCFPPCLNRMGPYVKNWLSKKSVWKMKLPFLQQDRILALPSTTDLFRQSFPCRSQRLPWDVNANAKTNNKQNRTVCVFLCINEKGAIRPHCI